MYETLAIPSPPNGYDIDLISADIYVVDQTSIINYVSFHLIAHNHELIYIPTVNQLDIHPSTAGNNIIG